MTKTEAIQHLAEMIWKYGETNPNRELLVVSHNFNPEELEIENALEHKCISYTLKWEEQGKKIQIHLFQNDSYGAGKRIKDIGCFIVETSNSRYSMTW